MSPAGLIPNGSLSGQKSVNHVPEQTVNDVGIHSYNALTGRLSVRKIYKLPTM